MANRDIEKGKVFYLFSSTQRPNYKQDNYNVLCYPAKFIIHFRYDVKWVSEKIIARMKNKGHHEFEGCNAVIILVADVESDNLIKPVFYPLRKAKISKIELVGNVLHVYLELTNEWVDYRNDDEPKNYHTLIEESLQEKPTSGEEKLGGKFFSLEMELEDLEFSTDISAWESIIGKIGDLDCHKNTLFYMINKFYDIDAKKNLELKKFDDLRCGYELKSGKKYDIELILNWGKEPPKLIKENKIAVEVDENFHMPIPNEIRLDFRIDKQNIYLSTKDLYFDTFTQLSITFKGGKNEDPKIEGPNVLIPIKITYDRRKVIGLFIMFFIGLVLTSGIIEVVFPNTLFVLSTVIAGAICSSVVLFILNRKLR